MVLLRNFADCGGAAVDIRFFDRSSRRACRRRRPANRFLRTRSPTARLLPPPSGVSACFGVEIHAALCAEFFRSFLLMDVASRQQQHDVPQHHAGPTSRDQVGADTISPPTALTVARSELLRHWLHPLPLRLVFGGEWEHGTAAVAERRVPLELRAGTEWRALHVSLRCGDGPAASLPLRAGGRSHVSPLPLPIRHRVGSTAPPSWSRMQSANPGLVNRQLACSLAWARCPRLLFVIVLQDRNGPPVVVPGPE